MTKNKKLFLTTYTQIFPQFGLLTLLRMYVLCRRWVESLQKSQYRRRKKRGEKKSEKWRQNFFTLLIVLIGWRRLLFSEEEINFCKWEKKRKSG